MAHYDLGNALAQAGRVSEAIAQYEQALRIEPDSAETHFNLGAVLVANGPGAGKPSRSMSRPCGSTRISPRRGPRSRNCKHTTKGKGCSVFCW